MQKKKVYISGRITGEPWGQVVKKFNEAADTLRGHGHEVINPIDINSDPNAQWETCMRADIKALMDCDRIYMLPCWENSRGAKVERQIAEAVGIEVLMY